MVKVKDSVVEKDKQAKRLFAACVKWGSATAFLVIVVWNVFNNTVLLSRNKSSPNNFVSTTRSSFSPPLEFLEKIQNLDEKIQKLDQKIQKLDQNLISHIQTNDTFSPNRESKETSQLKSGLSFVNTHCILGNEEWWPPVDSWKRRSPGFLIIGAKKCGTTSLHSFLGQHPLILPGRLKELLFFIPRRFPYWEKEKHWDGKVMVEPSRAHMYSKDYPVDKIRSNPSTMSFEATPDYILYSNYSTKAILCTIPWVKVVLLLRNPIDRLFSHYNFLKDAKHVGEKYAKGLEKTSFGAWVKKDMKTLIKAGVILPWNATASERQTFFGSQKESTAWKKYFQKNFGEHPVARSLYAFQLEEWFSALRSIGRDPRTDFKIVREENLKNNTRQIANEIYRWLNLPEHEITTTTSRMVTSYSATLDDATRQVLKDFFDPYNKRLYRLLGDEWDGIWD